MPQSSFLHGNYVTTYVSHWFIHYKTQHFHNVKNTHTKVKGTRNRGRSGVARLMTSSRTTLPLSRDAISCPQMRASRFGGPSAHSRFRAGPPARQSIYSIHIDQRMQHIDHACTNAKQHQRVTLTMCTSASAAAQSKIHCEEIFSLTLVITAGFITSFTRKCTLTRIKRTERFPASSILIFTTGTLNHVFQGSQVIIAVFS